MSVMRQLHGQMESHVRLKRLPGDAPIAVGQHRWPFLMSCPWPLNPCFAIIDLAGSEEVKACKGRGRWTTYLILVLSQHQGLTVAAEKMATRRSFVCLSACPTKGVLSDKLA